jgi:hypothetical protein
VAATDATRNLTDAWALFDIGRGGTSDVVSAAADALVAGVDSPSLRELAACSGSDSYWKLHPLVEATFAELEILAPDRDSDEAMVAAARAMARRVLDGRDTPREFTAWAHRVIGHEGPAELQHLVMLDDELDEATGSWWRSEDPGIEAGGRAGWEASVREAAARLLTEQ